MSHSCSLQPGLVLFGVRGGEHRGHRRASSACVACKKMFSLVLRCCSRVARVQEVRDMRRHEGVPRAKAKCGAVGGNGQVVEGRKENKQIKPGQHADNGLHRRGRKRRRKKKLSDEVLSRWLSWKQCVSFNV